MTQPDNCRVITGKDLTDPKAPNLSSYLVTKPERVPNPRLDLSTSPVGRRYKTVFRQQVQKGPNYAGHYRVVVWGCGSSCAGFAVVNLETGGVLDAEGVHAMSGVDFEVGDFLTGTDSEDTSFRYRKDSKLLIAIRAPDEDAGREGVFYYLSRDERLKLIHFTPAKKACP